MIEQLVSWLILRMEWVYGYVVNTLNLPSFVGYLVLATLIFIFFYDLYDIYYKRNRHGTALVWLLVVLLIPLGTLIYLAFGRNHLANTAPYLPKPTRTSSQTQVTNGQKKAATTLGTIVGTIAIVAGVIAVGFFIFVTIALIQCARDPKCM